MTAPAPLKPIGYTQAPNYNWWQYEDEPTPELQWPQSISVYDAMRKQDSQVASVLRAVGDPVRRTGWRIDPNGSRDEVIDLVADDLGLPVVGRAPKPTPRSKGKFSWPEHLRLALLMLPMGHAYFEQLYRVDDDGLRAHLAKLELRPSKTIERIEVATDGGLVYIKQYWTQTNTEPKPITVDRLVAYVYDREGGNWLGCSVLRRCYKNWLIKDRLLRVQAQTIERNGMGVPRYTAAEDETELETGRNLATSWRSGEAAGAAIPNGAQLDLVGVTGTLPDALPAIEYHDSQIARAVLAHFLNLGTQTGSWALGTTFADFFTLSLQTLAQQIADVATQHIIEDLVDINFGPNEPAPRLTFDEIGSRQAATAQALKSLVDAGVIHPDEVLEESSRQQYGLPPADPATATVPALDPSHDGTPPVPVADPSTRPGSVAAAGDAVPKGQAAPAAGYEQPALDVPEPVAAARKAWDPAKHPRDPVTGRFITLAAFADLVKKLDSDRTGSFDHRIKDAVTGMDAVGAAPLGLYNGDPGLVGALSSYVAGGHGDINKGLRAGNLSAPGRVRTVSEIDRGMRQSPLDSDAQVWRGVSKPENVFGSAWNDNDVSGLEWRDAGYGSTSAKQSVAERSMFAGKDGVVMRILAPKGTRALAILGPDDSDDFSEDELLIDRGTRYRVVADHGIVNGRRHLDVEIIHD